MARKTYTREFKHQALKMITDQGFSVAEVARRLGVTEGSLRTWRESAQEHGAAAFPGHGNPSPAEDELRRLRAENTRLKAERDLLKKARPANVTGSEPAAGIAFRETQEGSPCPRRRSRPSRPSPAI